MPRDLRQPYDVREVIARLVDGSEFHEFKALYGKTLVCGFAHLWGYPVAILANNGILFSESALKGAHFIAAVRTAARCRSSSCRTSRGFMVGKRYEAGGIARDGAKMVTAVACSTVPKLTVVIGGSFGAGNYAMCGRAYGARFLWTWPNARISVMGGEQAASVLATVRRDGIEAKAARWPQPEQDEFTTAIRDQYERQGNPYYATRAALGRRRHRPARHAPRARPRARGRRPRARAPARVLRRVPDVTAVLRIERDSRGIVTLTLDRPGGAERALSAELVARLTEALASLAGDAAVRAVLLTGSGTVFCAGADIGEMRASGAASIDQNEADSRRFALMLESLENCRSRPSRS